MSDKDLLIDFFYIEKPVYKKRQRRTHKVVKELEARGYSIEKSGSYDAPWEVWHNELHPGTTACYRTLAEIDPDYPI